MRRGNVWEVSDASGVVARAPTVILNLPAPQLVPLLSGRAVQAPEVEYAPAWAAGIVLRNDIEARPGLRQQSQHCKIRVRLDGIAHRVRDVAKGLVIRAERP